MPWCTSTLRTYLLETKELFISITFFWQLMILPSLGSFTLSEYLIHTSSSTWLQYCIYNKICNTFTSTCTVEQWIPLNRDRFLQPKKSRLTENPLYPKWFVYSYLVNPYSIYIPINRKSPITESRLTEIHCIRKEALHRRTMTKSHWLNGP